MKNQPQTETLFPEPAAMKKHACQECGIEYTYKHGRSKFCSLKCRDKYQYKKYKKKKQSFGDTTPVIGPEIKAPKQPAPATPGKTTPDTFLQNKNLPIDTQVAISLIKEDRDEWKSKCKALELENKELNEQLDTLEDELNAKEQALHGLEEQQPSQIERFIAAIPAPIMEQIAPHVGTLMGRLTGSVKNPLAGVGGQLDEQSLDALEKINIWFASLPPQFQQEVCAIFAALASAKDGLELSTVLNRIVNALTNEQKQQPKAAQPNYGFPNMFAATGTQ